MKATRRKPIKHITSLTDRDLFQLLELIDTMNITALDIPCSEKIDGMAYRFGLNEHGKFFTETSHSGPMYSTGEIATLSYDKHDCITDLSSNFMDIFNTLKSDSELQDILARSNKEMGVKVVGEMLYTPLATRFGDDTTTFNEVPYDNENLGNLITFVIRGVEFAEYCPNLVQNLVNRNTNSDIKFISTNLEMYSLDTTELQAMYEKLSQYTHEMTGIEVSKLLRTRRENLKTAREFARITMNLMKTLITTSLHKYKISTELSSTGILGAEVEGYVYTIGANQYKSV